MSADLLYFMLRLSTALFTDNPLRGLLPSQIDFGRNTTACSKITTESFKHKPKGYPAASFAEWLTPLLPPEFSALSPDSISAYWERYTLYYWFPLASNPEPWDFAHLAGTLGFCCQQHWDSCIPGIEEFNSAWYTQLSLQDLSFSDCRSTVDFWTTYLYDGPGSTVNAPFWWSSDSCLNMFRQLLPRPYTNATRQEVQYVLNKLLLQENFWSFMTQASNQCLPEYCLLLAFNGNADVAGKGVSLLFL